MLFHGVNPETLAPGIRVASCEDQGMPQRTISSVQLSQGAAFGGFQLQARTITVKINVSARSRTDALAVARLLAGWAHTDQPEKLVLKHELDKYYMAVCTGCSTKALAHTFLVLTYTFSAPNPIAYDNTLYVCEAGPAFSVGGTAPTPPTITYIPAANLSDVRFTLDGGAYIALSGELTAGQTITIDTAQRTITAGGITRMDWLDFIASRWFALDPGEHSVACSMAGMCQISWRSAWY